MRCQAPSWHNCLLRTWYDFHRLDFSSQRKGRKLDRKQSGWRVLPRRSCPACLCSQTVPRTLCPCSAGARPGTSSFWKVRCFTADALTTKKLDVSVVAGGRVLSASGPWPPQAGPCQRWLAALRGPTTGLGWTSARSRGFPSVEESPRSGLSECICAQTEKGCGEASVSSPEEEKAFPCALVGFALMRGYAQVCARSFA